MSGKGRRHHGRSKFSGEEQKKERPTITENDSPVLQLFDGFQQKLDKKHDKYERIVKLSRDITVESKRAIFTLHRYTGSLQNADTSLDESQEKLEVIKQEKWKLIAMELRNEDSYQFVRAYSPGLQEYVEAVSFLHYLKFCSLVSLQEIQALLTFNSSSEEVSNHNSTDQNPTSTSASLAEPDVTEVDSTAIDTQINCPEALSVTVPPSEYMLGLADLTGELMRLAINYVGGGNLQKPFEVCRFMRTVFDLFSGLNGKPRELNQKLWTFKQSLQKVEKACYTLQVRGSEIPQHMLKDVFADSGQDFQQDCDTFD